MLDFVLNLVDDDLDLLEDDEGVEGEDLVEEGDFDFFDFNLLGRLSALAPALSINVSF